MTRGLLLDWAAAAAPADKAAAASAATAGHALRKLDRRATLNDLRARAYLRDAFRDFDDQDDDAPHPYDCAGRCDGTGEVLTVLTWEHHGDDGYTAVPPGADSLRRGLRRPHPGLHHLRGTRLYYAAGYRELCLDGRIADDDSGALQEA